MFNKKVLVVIPVIAIVVSAYFLAPDFIGKPPVKEFVPKHSPDVNHDFPELKELREKIEKMPTDTKTLQELAEVLKGKVIATRDHNLIFELIDTLTKIIKVDPANKYALLELANISFESKVFSKAADYYQQYLNVVPDDLEVLGRFASCLIFQQKYDQGLSELERILAKDPKNFSALAYKAIALAESGQKEEAKKVGSVALSNAPDEEGKKRFQYFLDSIDRADNALLTYLQTNEVTSNKYQKLEKDGTRLILTFKDFPVDQMPEFAKQKFVGSLREQTARTKEYQDVVLIQVIDQLSKEVLLEVKQQ